MDQSIYDEFGNYIGPNIGVVDEESSEASSVEPEVEEAEAAPTPSEAADITAIRAVVPHEDKRYYPDAEEVYPGGVETLVEEEDTQPLTEPIIATVRVKDLDIVEKELPVTTFSYEFMASMMYQPHLIRQICFLGALHSGKTSVTDLFVQHTHNNATGTKWSLHKQALYTDSRRDELERGLSVKAAPISLILPASSEKSYLFHIFDTPGHPDFVDEVTAALRLCDGAVLVVDALMGMTSHTERLLHHAMQERMHVTLLINCIDRLILELRLPPADAYFKLRHTVEEINTSADQFARSLGLPRLRFSPSLSNVVFASAFYGVIFTTKSFAQSYRSNFSSTAEKKKGGWMRGVEDVVDVDLFTKCLWGDFYYNHTTRGFERTPTGPESQRSFIEFILNPIYKVFAHVVGEEKPTLQPVLEELGVFLRAEDFELDCKALLRLVGKQCFGDISAFVDVIVEKCAHPKGSAATKVEHAYSGSLASPVADALLNAEADSDILVVHTTKNYHRPDCSTFDAFGRVMSGTIRKGQRVKVLGEAFTLDEPEDSEVREITHLWIYQAGRYRVEISHVPAGNWVLIGGVTPAIPKTATMTNATITLPNGKTRPNTAEVEIFRPLKFPIESVIRVSCEPLNPSELPKMLEGFRRIGRAYPLCTTKLEESGELVIHGTGEIYLDCILQDLRKYYGDLEIKVADPVVQFCETVVETSSLKCFAETPNKKNTLHMVAEPLEKGLGEDIEKGRVKFPSTAADGRDRFGDAWDEKRLAEVLMDHYEWDILAAKSVWAFGPDDQGPNVLLDDVLPSNPVKASLGMVKDLVIRGFRWVTREGPLVEEKVRNCKFRILDGSFASDPSNRGGGQLIPTARRVAYSAFLLATPRLMEPVLMVEVECPADCVAAVYSVLARRRGHVTRDQAKPGTPMYIVHAFLPAIESFGFETDLRTHTSGQAFCLSTFDHWATAPGDPLDKSIVLRPLEPAPAPHLAREFLLKTRRRKGLSESVAVHKFFDEPMLAELARHEADLDQYML